MKKIGDCVKEVIEKNPVALATVCENGNPHVIAVAEVRVVEDKIIVTDNFMSTTKENIVKNANVSLAVWDKDWNGYRISGKASYHETGKWKDFVKQMPENNGLSAKGAILIDIEDVTKL
jgi:predicted pyridoxine 5'-phosphate oxidase superfamily flavin-nucleotide-binding protein